MKTSKAQLKREQVKKDMQEQGYWFVLEEINYIVREAKKFGFKAIPSLVKDKEFDADKVVPS